MLTAKQAIEAAKLMTEGCFPVLSSEWEELMPKLAEAGILDGRAFTRFPGHPANGCTGIGGRPVVLLGD